MNNNYKPEAYNSVSPYFIVADIKKWLHLLADLFGAEELSRYEHPERGLVHLELRIDDTVIMVSQASEEFPANKFLMHVYVPDAKQTYAKAISLGCTGIQEPVQKDDPDLRGMFMDFEGNTWAVGTKME